jgi:molecular chaperone DnaK (HSP70)
MCAAFMASTGYKGRTTVIGVDLGTTYSVVGIRPVSERGAPVGFDDVIIVPDAEGRILQPSNVAFLPDGEILVGHAAKKYRGKDAKHAIFNAKRFIGRHLDDEQVKHDASLFDFDVVAAPQAKKEHKMNPANGYFDVYGTRPEAWFKIDVDGHPKIVSPTIIGSKVVGRLAEMVSEYLGHGQVATAVIAVPAKFNVLQRQATELAFKNAGLKVMRIIEEPTAAAMAYGLLRRWDVHFILVFDFGGGTLDVSLLYVNEGSAQVIGDSGDNNLGGEFFLGGYALLSC